MDRKNADVKWVQIMKSDKQLNKAALMSGTCISRHAEVQVNGQVERGQTQKNHSSVKEIEGK